MHRILCNPLYVIVAGGVVRAPRAPSESVISRNLSSRARGAPMAVPLKVKCMCMCMCMCIYSRNRSSINPHDEEHE